MKIKFITLLKSINKGIQIGWSTPTLPTAINNFHNQPIIIFFRFIGTISILIILLTISLIIKDIPNYILYPSIFISFIYYIYMFIITIFRLIHSIKILFSDKLNVNKE